MSIDSGQNNIITDCPSGRRCHRVLLCGSSLSAGAISSTRNSDSCKSTKRRHCCRHYNNSISIRSRIYYSSRIPCTASISPASVEESLFKSVVAEAPVLNENALKTPFAACEAHDCGKGMKEALRSEHSERARPGGNVGRTISS